MILGILGLIVNILFCIEREGEIINILLNVFIYHISFAQFHKHISCDLHFMCEKYDSSYFYGLVVILWYAIYISHFKQLLQRISNVRKYFCHI